MGLSCRLDGRYKGKGKAGLSQEGVPMMRCHPKEGPFCCGFQSYLSGQIHAYNPIVPIVLMDRQISMGESGPSGPEPFGSRDNSFLVLRDGKSQGPITLRRIQAAETNLEG